MYTLTNLQREKGRLQRSCLSNQHCSRTIQEESGLNNTIRGRIAREKTNTLVGCSIIWHVECYIGPGRGSVVAQERGVGIPDPKIGLASGDCQS